MNPKEYQQLAARTECDQVASFARYVYYNKETIYTTGEKQSQLVVRLLHAVIGVTGEVGELSSAVEKWLHYGQTLDVTNLKEEIGDTLWYLALACNALGFDMEQVMEANIAKLKKRYPSMYLDACAAEENRNRAIERMAIDGTANSTIAKEQTQIEPEEEEKIPVYPLLPLSDSYPNRCSKCHRQPIHRSNETGVCPDCFQEELAERRKAMARTMEID